MCQSNSNHIKQMKTSMIEIQDLCNVEYIYNKLARIHEQIKQNMDLWKIFMGRKNEIVYYK